MVLSMFPHGNDFHNSLIHVSAWKWKKYGAVACFTTFLSRSPLLFKLLIGLLWDLPFYDPFLCQIDNVKGREQRELHHYYEEPVM